MDQYLILFLASCVLCVVSAYIYMKKDTSEVGKYNQSIEALRAEHEHLERRLNDISATMLNFDKDSSDTMNKLNHRMNAVEVKIVEVEKAPHKVELVMKQPMKMLVKQMTQAPAPKLPGMTPSLIKKVQKLSQ